MLKILIIEQSINKNIDGAGNPNSKQKYPVFTIITITEIQETTKIRKITSPKEKTKNTQIPNITQIKSRNKFLTSP